MTVYSSTYASVLALLTGRVMFKYYRLSQTGLRRHMCLPYTEMGEQQWLDKKLYSYIKTAVVKPCTRSSKIRNRLSRMWQSDHNLHFVSVLF